MILSLWKQSESSVPTDLPKTERERPAFRLDCNPFQGPERPGRTCSCILHTLRCISCKNLVLPLSLSLGISPGLTVLVLASSTEKLVVAQSRNLTEVVKSWLLVGEIQGGSKMCCYAISFSPGNTHCPHTVPGDGECSSAMRDHGPAAAQEKWVISLHIPTMIQTWGIPKKIRCPLGRSYPWVGGCTCLITVATQRFLLSLQLPFSIFTFIFTIFTFSKLFAKGFQSHVPWSGFQYDSSEAQTLVKICRGLDGCILYLCHTSEFYWEGTKICFSLALANKMNMGPRLGKKCL